VTPETSWLIDRAIRGAPRDSSAAPGASRPASSTQAPCCWGTGHLSRGTSLGYSRRPDHIGLLIANKSEKRLLSAIMRLSKFTVPQMERHLSRGFYGVAEGSGR
jgi:hypothetical protein